MPPTDFQSSSAPFSSLGRSILSIRRDQPHSSMDSDDLDLDAFQKQVSDLFQTLSTGSNPVLSLAWIQTLLDTFLICQEEFRVILFNGKSLVSRPPLDRLISEFFDRSVKALDVCNAVRDGIDLVRQWHRHLEIVISALASRQNQQPFGEGQLRRAKKALTDLTILMLNEDVGGSGSALTHRNRSFGRNTHGKDHHNKPGAHFRSLSWSVSRSWSAARQLQAISSNIAAPRGNEIAATSGMAIPVFTMNSVLLFVMWAMVAAIPCQDRGLQTHFSIPRNFSWAAAMLGLHDQILDESKKRERKNSSGLLREVHQIEKCSRHLMELTDTIQLPLGEEKEAEVRQAVEELTEVFNALKDGLDPLERQVREVFHRIVRSRTEGLDLLGKAHNPE